MMIPYTKQDKDRDYAEKVSRVQKDCKYCGWSNEADYYSWWPYTCSIDEKLRWCDGKCVYYEQGEEQKTVSLWGSIKLLLGGKAGNEKRNGTT